MGISIDRSQPWHQQSCICPKLDRDRRQALVELDALAALALDLTEEELITIYRVQFPVLRQYERENLYDQTGRLVPKGVLDLAKRHNIDIHQPLNVSTFTGPAELIGEVKTPGLGVTGGIVWEDPKMEPRMKRVYPPPFTKCDREADMRQAYRVFQERIAQPGERPMIPAIVADELRATLLDYLDTTFSFQDVAVAEALQRFLTDPKQGIFKGPYLRLQLPFRRAEAGRGQQDPRHRPAVRPLRPPDHRLRAAHRQGQPPAAAHPGHHRHRLGQDRVLPLPAARPLPSLRRADRASRPSSSTR